MSNCRQCIIKRFNALKTLTQEELEKFFLDIDEPSFRAKQLLKWVHQKGAYYTQNTALSQ